MCHVCKYTFVYTKEKSLERYSQNNLERGEGKIFISHTSIFFLTFKKAMRMSHL